MMPVGRGLQTPPVFPCGIAAARRASCPNVARRASIGRTVVRYVLENPVRARLVASPEDYPYSGSFVYEYGELMEWAFGWNRPE